MPTSNRPVLRVADRWFRRIDHPDGVTQLVEPHVHSLIRCNIFHVRGRDRDLVVDTGLGAASLRDELADLTDRPVVAVATHIHYDHVGGLHEFDTRAMHQLEAPRMNPYREFAGLVRDDFDAATLEMLGRIGYGIDDDALVDALPDPDYRIDRFRITPTTPNLVLDEGDRIDLGDRTFEVLHLPGHSPGNLGLWERRTGTLLTGDAIYDGPLIDSLPDSDIADYLATMERLRRVPATVVHGGHDPSFGRDRLIELADANIRSRS